MPSPSLYVSDVFALRGLFRTTEANVRNDPSVRRPRILVVDDERLIADTLHDILVNAGYEVITAYDGWNALEMVESFHPEYLLSDVTMPQMNGVELAMAIRKSYPATKILLFSGQAGIADILSAGEEQGYEFELLSKPMHPRDLIDIIKRK